MQYTPSTTGVLVVGAGPTGLLLAGDATHVHSPVGGQGMNTGPQDSAQPHLEAVHRAARPGAAPPCAPRWTSGPEAPRPRTVTEKRTEA